MISRSSGASRRASARERLMWGKSVHKNVLLSLAKPTTTMISRRKINAGGIPNSTVWESVTREPPQPGNHLEPAGNPHRNLHTTTSGTLWNHHIPTWGTSALNRYHWSFIWAETPKLTLLWKKSKPFPLQKNIPARDPKQCGGGVGG